MTGETTYTDDMLRKSLAGVPVRMPVADEIYSLIDIDTLEITLKWHYGWI